MEEKPILTGVVLVGTAREVYCSGSIELVDVEEERELRRSFDTHFVVVAEDDIAVVVIKLEGAEAQDFIVCSTWVLLDVDIIVFVLQFALEAAGREA